MKEIPGVTILDIRSVLSSPQVFEFFTQLVGGKSKAAKLLVDRINPRPGLRVLDIGCGTGKILDLLPGVEYVGFDVSERYIRFARAKRGNRGAFHAHVVDIAAADSLALRNFDVVMAIGVLHHLDDGAARNLFAVAAKVLKPGGKLITLDGCYVEGQSAVARWIISKDRGQHVRDIDGYLSVARPSFPLVEYRLYDNLLRIPYTHILLECSAGSPSGTADSS